MHRTGIIKIHEDKAQIEVIETAAKLIRQGGLVVYPTESAYALGCNALDEAALIKVYAAKARASTTPIPVIISDMNMWRKYAITNEKAEALAEKFWPGPLTIALRKKPIVPDALNPIAIAVRMSSNKVASSLVREARLPISATSANNSGSPPHYSIKQVLKDLDGKVDLVLDSGRLARRKVSTIIDFTLGPTPRITRIGAVPVKAISKIVRVKVIGK